MNVIYFIRQCINQLRSLIRRPKYRRISQRINLDGFDLKYGTDTAPLMDTYSSAKRPMYRYETATTAAIITALDSLQTDFSNFTFLDFGCGKGKPLIIAASYSFLRVIGVDIDASCIALAAENIKICGLTERIELFVADATEFPLPEGPLLVYLFNPFPAPIVAQVLQRLVQRVQTSPVPVAILYMNPEHAGLIEKSGVFREVARTVGVSIEYERSIAFVSISPTTPRPNDHSEFERGKSSGFVA